MKICVNGWIMLNRSRAIKKRRKGECYNSCNRMHGILAVHTIFVLWLLCIFIPPTAIAAEGHAYIELDSGYNTGDFGTPTRYGLYYFTPVFGYLSPAYGFSVATPYLRLTSKTGGQSTTETGMGDIILRGDMALISEGKSGFSLDGAMAVKLPTADEAKGLGTGETDYGTFVSLHQRFQEIKFSFMAGYIKTGDPSSFDYNDIYLYGFGVSRLFGRTNIYSSFEGRRSIIPGTKNPQELVFGFFYILNNWYSLKGNVSFGLNDGTQDFGSNIGLLRWF